MAPNYAEYRRGADGMREFLEVTDDEVHALLQAIINRLMRLLVRGGGRSKGLRGRAVPAPVAA